MSGSSPVFAQMMSALHPQEFARCAEGFPPPRRSHALSAYDHSLALCFAQLTGREGLRDLVVCLNARPAAATGRFPHAAETHHSRLRQ